MTVWPHPVVLVVLDGFGLREEEEANAIAQADTPTLDRLMDAYPWTTLTAHGESVGLPEGALGGSEVGHMQLGAGRLVKETPKRIDDAIADGSFHETESLDHAFRHAEQKDSQVHLIGLCSDAYVHSHIGHLKALLEVSTSYDVDVVIHPILDGRDTGPRSAKPYLETLTDWAETYDAAIGAVMGRYYGMDRDKNWERTEKAYRALVEGKPSTDSSVLSVLDDAYADGVTDEFLEPIQVDDRTIDRDDTVIMFNFRADRARQLTQCFYQPADIGFADPIDGLHLTTMTQYKDSFDIPVLFDRHTVDETLGEWLAEHKIAQLRVAESEKHAHVTYFFNGREEDPYELEDRMIFDSPDVPTYDETPGMRAEAITAHVCDAIEAEDHGFILANLSNADMIGHTGSFDAAVDAVEIVDACLDRIKTMVDGSDYTLIVTADHGNADDMGGEQATSHTRNPVPCIVCSDAAVSFSEDADGLYQIAPAILAMNDHVSAAMGQELFTHHTAE